ncbi:MAG: DUF456 domain-containing protein [Patescibacteria group bacterium]
MFETFLIAVPYWLVVSGFGLALFATACLVLIPLFPALSLMFALALAFVAFDQFLHISATGLAILAGIWVLSVCIDYASGILGAKYGGASAKSILWGVIGMVLGSLFFIPFGSFAGLFLGVLIAEFVAHKNEMRAFKAASGGAIGSLVGVAINALLALTFLTLFIIFSL